MRNFGECETIFTGKVLVLSENKSRMEIMNPAQAALRRVQVDGCAIRTGPRCDFLVITPADSELFIELKGSHILRAGLQLQKSMEQLSSSKDRECFIVSSRVPLATDAQRLKNYFRDQLQTPLTIKNRSCNYTV